MKKINQTVEQLQARKKALELDLTIARAKPQTEVTKAQIEAKQAELDANETNMALAEIQAAAATKLAADADAAIQALVASGDVAPQDEKRKTELKAAFSGENGALVMEQVAGQALKAQSAAALTGGSGGAKLALTGGRMAPIAGALTAIDGRINEFGLEAGANKSYSYELSGGWNAREAIAGYFEMASANAKCRWEPSNHRTQDEKHAYALACAQWYNTHLKKDLDRWQDIPVAGLGELVGLKAGDYADPNVATYSNLGTLTGTLVLQRTLPVFAYKYPEIFAMTTDFSDTPGLYNQTETTRIITQPPVQTYVPTLTNGRPGGWSTAVEGVATDVSITLNKYVGVPITIGQNILGATTRKLFDEQSTLAIKAIAGYLVSMATDLMSAATYNSYATASATVPFAYPTFPVTSQTFSMTVMDKLDAVFTSAKVPEDDRFLLLNPTFFSLLRADTRLWFMYAASAKDAGSNAGEFLMEAKLPKLSGFAPYKAGYMPTSTPSTTPTTTNVVGFAGQKAGIILKSRLPQDFSAALNGVMIPGSITTVTDLDTKMSIMLVQYVNLQGNYAEWRPEVMLGAASGDPRAGLVLTGQ